MFKRLTSILIAINLVLVFGLGLIVTIPAENEKDLKEIPPRVKKDLKIVLVEYIDDVLRRALILNDPDTFLKKQIEQSEEFFGSSNDPAEKIVTH